MFLHKLFGKKDKEKKVKYESKTNGFAFLPWNNVFEYNEKTQQERFQACMVLGAFGDAFGYRKGKWEFSRDGREIHNELESITQKRGLFGISVLNIEPKEFPVSDDSVMCLASARALVDEKSNARSYSSFDAFGTALANEYIACWEFMPGRMAGITCGEAIFHLNSEREKKNPQFWQSISFN